MVSCFLDSQCRFLSTARSSADAEKSAVAAWRSGKAQSNSMDVLTVQDTEGQNQRQTQTACRVQHFCVYRDSKSPFSSAKPRDVK